ncbi:MAG: hypothetical protein H0U59_01385 [Gemmatimonadaceae bacterium]|nr:hypothetical protein [Gemmatimonadaceae bacterium]
MARTCVDMLASNGIPESLKRQAHRPAALAALDRLAAEHDRLTEDRDVWRKEAKVWEEIAERREQDAQREHAAVEYWSLRSERAERRVEELERALRVIEALESDGGTYDVMWVWDGVWEPQFKVIARDALTSAAATEEQGTA